MRKIIFQKRGFTSLLTGLSFAVMAVSGVLLFAVPQGRIAEWTDWRMLGLAKSDWGNLHIATSLLFLAAGTFHTWYNWDALVHYFARRKSPPPLKRETVLATVVLLFFVVGAVYRVPPFNYVIAFNEYVKQLWIIDKDYEPPIGHAELLTMESFARRMNIDLALATEELRRQGISAGPRESLANIAKAHGTAPVKIYALIRKYERDYFAAGAVPETAAIGAPVPAAGMRTYTEDLVEERFEGRGVGRKKLAVICAENKLDIGRAREKLAARQLLLKDDETLKAASERFRVAPVEILKVVLVGEPVPR